jgi:hypothetical protein
MTDPNPAQRPSASSLLQIVFQESVYIAGSWFSVVRDVFTKSSVDVSDEEDNLEMI